MCGENLPPTSALIYANFSKNLISKLVVFFYLSIEVRVSYVSLLLNQLLTYLPYRYCYRSSSSPLPPLTYLPSIPTEPLPLHPPSPTLTYLTLLLVCFLPLCPLWRTYPPLLQILFLPLPLLTYLPSIFTDPLSPLTIAYVPSPYVPSMNFINVCLYNFIVV